MKTRKPRTTGSDLNFESGHIFDGSPCPVEIKNGKATYSIAVTKLKDREQKGLCLGCGKNPCVCRSKHIEGSHQYRNGQDQWSDHKNATIRA